jgi:galactoside O-acetyltransferase
MVMLERAEVERMGFRQLGHNVLISSLASFHNCAGISIGNNVRIDDFCVLSAGAGGIFIGNYVHVAVYSSLIGAGAINISDYCNLSSRVSIYSSNDDYTGRTMTNPTVPARFTGVSHAPVRLAKHVIIGSGSIVLPGVVLEEGAAVGALSLVNKDCKAFSIYSGVPARFVMKRSRDLLEAEKALIQEGRA